MAKFEVTSGIVISKGKSHYQGDTLELTDSQAEGLEKVVTPVVVKEAEQAVASGAKKPSELNFDELKALAAERNIEVEGTGKNGTVKKVDYVKALEEK